MRTISDGASRLSRLSGRAAGIRKERLILLIGFCVLSSSTAWSHPILSLDQSNVGVPFQGFTIPGGAAVGQGFTPTSSDLDVVELQMNSQTGLAGSAFVRIRFGGIGGPILGVSSIETIPAGPPSPLTLVHLDFAVPVPLSPGSLHVLEVVHSAGSDLGVFLTPGFGFNPYPGGTAFKLGISQPGDDFWFREGLSIPEPTTLALLWAGLAGLGAHSRRRRSRVSRTV